MSAKVLYRQPSWTPSPFPKRRPFTSNPEKKSSSGHDIIATEIPWDQLPAEVAVIIFSYLRPQDVKGALVSRKWASIISEIYWRDRCVNACPCLRLARWPSARDYKLHLKAIQGRTVPRCEGDEISYLHHTAKMLHASADSYRGYELEQVSIAKTLNIKAIHGSTVKLILRCFEEKLRVSHFGEQSARGWQTAGRMVMLLEDATSSSSLSQTPKEVVLCDVHITSDESYKVLDDPNMSCSPKETRFEMIRLKKQLGVATLSESKLFRVLLEIFAVFDSQCFSSFQPVLENYCRQLDAM